MCEPLPAARQSAAAPGGPPGPRPAKKPGGGIFPPPGLCVTAFSGGWTASGRAGGRYICTTSSAGFSHRRRSVTWRTGPSSSP